MRDEPVMFSREQWAEVSEELNTLRARVAELEDKCQRFQMAAMDNRNWCQAAEAQLTRLREENRYLKEIYVDMGLHDLACRIDSDGECDCWHDRFAAELQSLLDQTAKVEGK